MKIRMGHVSNSSSSSFAIAIYNKSDKVISFDNFAKKFFASNYFEKYKNIFLEIYDEDKEEDIYYIEKFKENWKEDFDIKSIPKGLNLYGFEIYNGSSVYHFFLESENDSFIIEDLEIKTLDIE
jgi:hypothetical protein